MKLTRGELLAAAAAAARWPRRHPNDWIWMGDRRGPWAALSTVEAALRERPELAEHG